MVMGKGILLYGRNKEKLKTGVGNEKFLQQVADLKRKICLEPDLGPRV